jgi:pimeloyl-ACP methyl ester carboxylesterase
MSKETDDAPLGRITVSAYEDAVDQQYLESLQGQITTFLEACNSNQRAATQPVAIFFFPGGLGSRLIRATLPAPDGPPYFYYTVWLDCTILFGVAQDLELVGVEDWQDEYIVPAGPIALSYDGFIQWCAESSLPLFFCGWDWRRKSGRAAHVFFLNKLLPAIDAAVVAGRYAYNPLNNFWLVGHSFGGMVVKRILNETNNGYVKKMKGAITVATPFYGSGGQVHRFFVGQTDLNPLLGPNGAATCTKIVSTLPANYEILFLDQATFDANQTAFLQDPGGYNLTRYPSVDAVSGQPADPYHPVPGPPPIPPATGVVRYAQNYNFSWNLLSDGLTASQLTSQYLDPSIAGKLWNVRYVQTDDDGSDLNETVVSQTWAEVPANFDPDVGPDPITDTSGPGDGVVPAWSARLIGLDNSHVVTLRAPGIEHANLMNEDIVQEQLAALLDLPPQLMLVAQASAVTTPLNAASRDQLNALTKQLRDATSAPLSPDKRKKAILKILGKLSRDQRRALLARAYIDAYKSPSQLSGSSDQAQSKGSKEKAPSKSIPKPQGQRKRK